MLKVYLEILAGKILGMKKESILIKKEYKPWSEDSHSSSSNEKEEHYDKHGKARHKHTDKGFVREALVTYSDNLHAYTWDLARYVGRTNRIHRQCYNGRSSTTGVIFDLFLLALFIHIVYTSWIYASLAQLFWGAQDKGKTV